MVSQGVAEVMKQQDDRRAKDIGASIAAHVVHSVADPNFAGGEGEAPVASSDPDSVHRIEVVHVKDETTGNISEIPRHTDRYDIGEKLGEGGMAVVYLATAKILDREVALKFLPEGLTVSPTAADLFIKEAKAVAKLNHPNIITIFDYGVIDNRPFICMEVLNGRPLNEVIDDADTEGLGLMMAVDVTDGLLAALEFAHANDVVHRDIKPSNMMVTENGSLKLMDFGIAKILEPSGKTTKIAGTPSYMAPEQMVGRGIDPRTDIFAAGVALYEMVTGYLPFEGMRRDLLPIPPKQLRPAISKELNDFILKAVSFEKDDRHADAADARRELRPVRRLLEDAGEVSLAPAAPPPLPDELSLSAEMHIAEELSGELDSVEFGDDEPVLDMSFSLELDDDEPELLDDADILEDDDAELLEPELLEEDDDDDDFDYDAYTPEALLAPSADFPVADSPDDDDDDEPDLSDAYVREPIRHQDGDAPTVMLERNEDLDYDIAGDIEIPDLPSLDEEFADLDDDEEGEDEEQVEPSDRRPTAELMAALEDESELTRIEALEEISDEHLSSFAPALVQRLADPETSGLSATERRTTYAALIRLSGDEHIEVLRSAFVRVVDSPLPTNERALREEELHMEDLIDALNAAPSHDARRLMARVRERFEDRRIAYMRYIGQGHDIVVEKHTTPRGGSPRGAPSASWYAEEEPRDEEPTSDDSEPAEAPPSRDAAEGGTVLKNRPQVTTTGEKVLPEELEDLLRDYLAD